MTYTGVCACCGDGFGVRLGGAVTALASARPQAMRIDTQRVEIEALEARLFIS